MDKDQMLIDSLGKTVQVQSELIAYLKAEIERLKLTVATYNPIIDPKFYVQPSYPQNPQPFLPQQPNAPFVSPPYSILCEQGSINSDITNDHILNGGVSITNDIGLNNSNPIYPNNWSTELKILHERLPKNAV